VNGSTSTQQRNDKITRPIQTMGEWHIAIRRP